MIVAGFGERYDFTSEGQVFVKGESEITGRPTRKVRNV